LKIPSYKVILEARGPLVLGDSIPTGNVQSSRAFVAGSVIRGVLAKDFLMPHGLWKLHAGASPNGLQPEAFRHVFLEKPAARFGFLYPVLATTQNHDSLKSCPIPSTASSCKVESGFGTDKGHGVFDRLLENLRHEAGDKSERLRACPASNCGERLERFRGFAAYKEGNAMTGTHRVKVEPQTFVRVGLNRWTETAEEGILYTLEALVPGSGDEDHKPSLAFVGYWTMHETQWQDLKTLLDEHLPFENGAYNLRIGTARARGMGEVALYLPEKPEPSADLNARLELMQPRDQQQNLLDPAHLYFSLTLRSPLLLYDVQGQPARTISSEILKDYVQLPNGLEFLARASFIEQETWSGWSSAWGLPKPVVPAMAPGSVLAFRAPAVERESVVKFWQEVQETGLGERLAEGWGEVVPCDPFHLTFDSRGNYESSQNPS